MASAVAMLTAAVSCSRHTAAVTPQTIAQQYGVGGAYADTIPTPDGPMQGTVVPVTLADGRRAQLIVPTQPDDPHGAYLRDDSGFHPVEVPPGVTREQVSQAPMVVGQRPDPPHPHRRSWERDALLVGGGAGAGTAIGALAGGGKGAAVGAATGGIGGLIYDLATRNRR